MSSYSLPSLQIISATVDDSMDEVVETARKVEPPAVATLVEQTGTATVAEPSVAETNAAEPCIVEAPTHKRLRTESGTVSSETKAEAGPVWQVGSDNGWDSAIWWRDCAEPFQNALGAQYQATIKKVAYNCRTPNGRIVSYRHNLEKMLQTNLTNGITKMLRRISAISLPLEGN